MTTRRAAAIAITAATIVGCAGKVDYVRPSVSPQGANAKVVDAPKDAVWNATIPELGKRYFVINNLDKSSGLINLSYSGDPERYIDCGRIKSYVKNARGERTYDFPGSKAFQSYEVMDPGAGLFFIERRMSLEGRVNLVFEEVSSTQTRVTANTRYVVQRQSNVQRPSGEGARNFNDSISFNSGGTGAFSSSTAAATVECSSTGELEREILSAVR